MRNMLLILCAMLLFGGCAPKATTAAAPVEAARPSEAPHASQMPPVPQAMPAPDANELTRDFLHVWREALEPDVSAYFPENFFDKASPWQVLDAAHEERLWLAAMAAAVEEQLDASIERARLAFSRAERALTLDIKEQSMEGPSWQLLCALVQGCESPAEANARIGEAMALNADSALNGQTLSLSLWAEPLPYREALRLPDEEAEAYWGRCFSYSYLCTVYGPDMLEVEYELPPAEGSLADGICWPLGSHTRLRKTWYADRSGGKRKHTGTDIWAKADAEIYSCTGGVVTYVGYGKGTGFTVVVTDGGYQYHYCHMIRQSDFLREGDSVSAGDLIGNVGNTGNSALDHLHLSIVAPDGKYINPYSYLAAVEP